jgi:hypothetical protein
MYFNNSLNYLLKQKYLLSLISLSFTYFQKDLRDQDYQSCSSASASKEGSGFLGLLRRGG